MSTRSILQERLASTGTTQTDFALAADINVRSFNQFLKKNAGRRLTRNVIKIEAEMHRRGWFDIGFTSRELELMKPAVERAVEKAEPKTLKITRLLSYVQKADLVDSEKEELATFILGV